MKKLSVLFLIAILGVVLGALPAGAEKIRMTDAELDGISAGLIPAVQLTLPPKGSPALCCVNVMLGAGGFAMPPTGMVFLDIWTKPGNPDPVGGVEIHLESSGMVPGSIHAGGTIKAPGGISVPLSFNLPF